MKHIALATFAAASLFVGTAASAQTVFQGQDDGSAVGGPQPNSDAAAASFLASAATYGTLNTVTFDSTAVGEGNAFSFPGLTIVSSQPGLGNGLTGISDTTLGNLYGYDISAGGTGNWFGFPTANATFTFAAPTNSFGFYTTGLQTSFTGSSFLVNIGGITYTPVVNVNGGATYFGFTSPTAFTSVIISNQTNDAWGIDSVTYGLTAAVPEPATWAMMIVGFGVVGGTMRSARRSSRKLEAKLA